MSAEAHAAAAPGVSVPRAILGLLGVAVLYGSCGILIGAMPSLLSLGGYCATGGPYEIAVQCPTWMAAVLGVSVPLMILSIFGTMLTTPKGWRYLGLLTWPLIFTVLGVEFLIGGIANLPLGAAWGYLVCGIVFVPMGLGPIWLMKRPMPPERRARYLRARDRMSPPVPNAERVRRQGDILQFPILVASVVGGALFALNAGGLI